MMSNGDSSEWKGADKVFLDARAVDIALAEQRAVERVKTAHARETTALWFSLMKQLNFAG